MENHKHNYQEYPGAPGYLVCVGCCDYKRKRKMPPHWYKIDVEYCVLCGHEDVSRERQYTSRPVEDSHRITLHETACAGHFL